MALITRAAMQYPEFRQIVDTKSFDWQGEKWQSKLTNLNQMLYYYPGSIGVKTGFTSAAHCTLVEAATRNNQTFLAVLMDTQSNVDIRHDAGKLLDYAFAQFQTETLMKKGTIVGQFSPSSGNSIPVATGVDVLATTRNQNTLAMDSKIVLDTVSHDLPQGARVGWMKVSVGDGQAVSVPVVLTQSLMVHKSAEYSVVPPKSMYWTLAVICLVMVVILVYWVYKRRQIHRSPGNFSSPGASL
jgi:D-alanyl-D-alanine carboxypeptidase (penicillin-binding protein 5/6)